jgi:F-type H+-transporting ATPase subunit b
MILIASGLLSAKLGLFVWTAIAFTIVALLLGKFAWKPIINTLQERESSIADSIASADKVRAEMANLKSENENLLLQAREERSLILKEAKAEKDSIIAEAKNTATVEANRILAEAREQIMNEKNRAMTDLKNQVGTLAIELSEKVLRKELSDRKASESYINTLASEIKLN